MSAEILKGYRLRKGNRPRLIESVCALWKYSWIEDGQLCRFSQNGRADAPR